MQAEDDIHALWLIYCQLKEAVVVATNGYEADSIGPTRPGTSDQPFQWPAP